MLGWLDYRVHASDMREKTWWNKSTETCDVATIVSNINHLIKNKGLAGWNWQSRFEGCRLAAELAKPLRGDEDCMHLFK